MFKRAYLNTDNDLDGMGPFLVLKKSFPNMKINTTYCGKKDGQADNRVLEILEEMDTESILFITDIGIRKETADIVDRYYRDGYKVVLLDHHISNEFLNDYEWAKVESVNSNGVKTCATTLFYEYLVEKNIIEHNHLISCFAEKVRLYDTWDWEEAEDNTAKQLNDLFYLLRRTDFKESVFESLKANTEEFIIPDKYQYLLNIEQQRIEDYIKAKSKSLRVKEIYGKQVGVVYAENYYSELGNELGKMFPELDIITMVNISTSKLSFRTIKDDVSVAEFASTYFNGGGHPKASGGALTPENFDLFVFPYVKEEEAVI